MTNAGFTVFEYGYLCADKDADRAQGYTLIADRDFDYLEKRCLMDDGSGFNQLLQLRIRGGCRLLQVQNYVGVIFLPSGQHVEVLPKTGRKAKNPAAAVSQARRDLLVMLQALVQFRHIQLDASSLQTLKLPLLEIFISRFLAEVNHVVKRGLRCDYVRLEDNLRVKKGKLDIKQQIRHNSVQQHRFYCAYDEYLQDRPENRLLKSAMVKVQSYSKNPNNQKWLRELLFAFDEVPVSRNLRKDLSVERLDRGMAHYQGALAWARLILNETSPVSMRGSADAPSLLFPMEAVFEAYVARELGKQLAQGYCLSSQSAQTHLVKHDNQNWFRLKPDLLISSGQGLQSVLDTKWKVLDEDKSNATEKYGLSQADFYQMFAYGQNYLSGCGEMLLIYPLQDSFNKPIEHAFEFTDLQGNPSALKLWLVPFEIHPCGSKLHLPAASSVRRYFTATEEIEPMADVASGQ